MGCQSSKATIYTVNNIANSKLQMVYGSGAGLDDTSRNETTAKRLTLNRYSISVKNGTPNEQYSHHEITDNQRSKKRFKGTENKRDRVQKANSNNHANFYSIFQDGSNQKTKSPNKNKRIEDIKQQQLDECSSIHRESPVNSKRNLLLLMKRSTKNFSQIKLTQTENQNSQTSIVEQQNDQINQNSQSKESQDHRQSPVKRKMQPRSSSQNQQYFQKISSSNLEDFENQEIFPERSKSQKIQKENLKPLRQQRKIIKRQEQNKESDSDGKKSLTTQNFIVQVKNIQNQMSRQPVSSTIIKKGILRIPAPQQVKNYDRSGSQESQDQSETCRIPKQSKYIEGFQLGHSESDSQNKANNLSMLINKQERFNNQKDNTFFAALNRHQQNYIKQYYFDNDLNLPQMNQQYNNGQNRLIKNSKPIDKRDRISIENQIKNFSQLKNRIQDQIQSRRTSPNSQIKTANFQKNCQDNQQVFNHTIQCKFKFYSVITLVQKEYKPSLKLKRNNMKECDSSEIIEETSDDKFSKEQRKVLRYDNFQARQGNELESSKLRNKNVVSSFYNNDLPNTKTSTPNKSGKNFHYCQNQGEKQGKLQNGLGETLYGGMPLHKNQLQPAARNYTLIKRASTKKSRTQKNSPERMRNNGLEYCFQDQQENNSFGKVDLRRDKENGEKILKKFKKCNQQKKFDPSKEQQYILNTFILSHKKNSTNKLRIPEKSSSTNIQNIEGVDKEETDPRIQTQAFQKQNMIININQQPQVKEKRCIDEHQKKEINQSRHFPQATQTSSFLEKSQISEPQSSSDESFIQTYQGTEQIDLLPEVKIIEDNENDDISPKFEKIDIPSKQPQKQSSLNLPIIGKENPSIRTDSKTSHHKSSGRHPSKLNTNKSLTMKENSSLRSQMDGGTHRRNTNTLPKINIFDDPFDNQNNPSSFVFQDLENSSLNKSYNYHSIFSNANLPSVFFESTSRPTQFQHKSSLSSEGIHNDSGKKMTNQTLNNLSANPQQSLGGALRLNSGPIQAIPELQNLLFTKSTSTLDPQNFGISNVSSQYKIQNAYQHLNSLNTLHPLRNSRMSDLFNSPQQQRNARRKRAYSENKQFPAASSSDPRNVSKRSNSNSNPQKQYLRDLKDTLKKVNVSIKSSMSLIKKEENIGFFDKPQNNLQALVSKFKKYTPQMPKESSLTIALTANFGFQSQNTKNQNFSENKSVSFGGNNGNEQQSFLYSSLNFAKQITDGLMGSVQSLPRTTEQLNPKSHFAGNKRGKKNRKPQEKKASQFIINDNPSSKRTIQESDSDYDDEVQRTSIKSSDLNFMINSPIVPKDDEMQEKSEQSEVQKNVVQETPPMRILLNQMTIHSDRKSLHQSQKFLTVQQPHPQSSQDVRISSSYNLQLNTSNLGSQQKLLTMPMSSGGPVHMSESNMFLHHLQNQHQNNGHSVLDSLMLKSNDGGQNYTQYSGKNSNYLNTSHNHSQLDSRYANYSSQQENIGQFDEGLNFVSDSEGSLSVFDAEQDYTINHRKMIKQHIASESKQVETPQAKNNMVGQSGAHGQYLETQQLSNQYSIHKKNNQHSSASVVYNYQKGSSSDIVTRTYISGSVSRKATSQLRMVQFKPSDKSILSKGSSKDVDPFIKRLMHQEDDEYWVSKQTRLKAVKTRISATDQQFRF